MSSSFEGKKNIRRFDAQYYGLGLERRVLFVRGMTIISDILPFPRTQKSVNF